jgi:hypothetical protein
MPELLLSVRIRSRSIGCHCAEMSVTHPTAHWGQAGAINETRPVIRRCVAVALLVVTSLSVEASRTSAQAPLSCRTPGGNTSVIAPIAATATGGYLMLCEDGTVFGFGDLAPIGDEASVGATTALAVAPGGGYWVLTTDGRVLSQGVAVLGDPRAVPIADGERWTAISATADGTGYWTFSDRGRVASFGSARAFGDLVQLGIAPVGGVIASAATATDAGYFMIGSDGGVFAFGDARFRGSMGGQRLNGPVVGIAPDPDGDGYWLVADDGGIFAFAADFRGSMGGQPLNRPVVGAIAYGNGYLMVASDGGIFAFSNRAFLGSLGANPPPRPIVAVAARTPGALTGSPPGTTTTTPEGTTTSTTAGGSTPPTTSGVPQTSFGEGLTLVAPGRYRTVDATDDCFWERRRALTTRPSDVIASSAGNGHRYVDVLPGDIAVRSIRCGSWRRAGDLGAVPDGPGGTEPGDGNFVVGVGAGSDIAFGRWMSEPAGECRWETATDFSAAPDKAIGSDAGPGVRFVDLAAGGVPTFSSAGCGSWRRATTVPYTTNPSGPIVADGQFRVGIDVAAGTWTSAGEPGCSWARRSAFDGTGESLIEQSEGGAGESEEVTLAVGEGFDTADCGGWTRVS